MPISYTKRGWTNNSPPAINAANLGAMDDGLKLAVDALNTMGDAGQLAVKEIGAAPASTTGGKLVNKITEAGYSLAPATGASNLDNIADGASYRRVQAAKADAINGGTFDAASVLAAGIGGSVVVLGAGATALSGLTKSGLYLSGAGDTYEPWAGSNAFVLHLDAGGSFAIQLAFRLTASLEISMKARQRTAATPTWAAWYEIFNAYSDGNGGQPPAPKPRVGSSDADIGRWRNITSGSNEPLYLPSGGTWAYFNGAYNTTTYVSNMPDGCNVAAGGSLISAARGVGNGNWAIIWRIA